MLGRWSFRLICWYILILMTQPHFRFPILIPLHLGDLCFGGAFVLHIFDCMTQNKAFIRNSGVTRFAFLLMGMILAAHYWNPHQNSTDWNTHVDGVTKISIIVILLDAQLDSVYKSSAVFGVLALGTLWWIKGGVRLASAGAYWASTTRLQGANVSIITNPNDFAYLTTFFLPIYYYFFVYFKPKLFKLGMLAVLFSGIYIVLQTGSRTGFLCMLAMAGGMIPRVWKKNKSFFPIAGLTIFLLLPFIPQGNLDRLTSTFETITGVFEDKNLQDTSDLDVAAESAQSRWIKIRGTFLMILQNPIGVGTDPQYWYVTKWWGAAGTVHNELMMAGRTMGFPGMIMYILALVLPLKYATRIMRRTENGVWPVMEALAWTVRVQLIVIVMGGMFSPSFFHFPHMMTFVAVSGLWRSVQEAVPEGAIAAPYGMAMSPSAQPVVA